MARIILGGFHGLMPHPPREQRTVAVPGLRHGTRALQFRCRVLGQDLWVVNGAKLKAYDAAFDGVALYTEVDYVPKPEIWLADTRREWMGYRAANAVITVLLMQARKWDAARARRAGTNLEVWLRDIAATHGGSALPIEMPRIWAHSIDAYMPGLEADHVDDMARQASRQLWKYL